MKKITVLPNSEHIVKCSFCEEKFKENKMLIFHDWDCNIWCCEDSSCRNDFAELIQYYDVGDE